jgi:hypothetical protein
VQLGPRPSGEHEGLTSLATRRLRFLDDSGFPGLGAARLREGRVHPPSRAWRRETRFGQRSYQPHAIQPKWRQPNLGRAEGGSRPWRRNAQKLARRREEAQDGIGRMGLPGVAPVRVLGVRVNETERQQAGAALRHRRRGPTGARAMRTRVAEVKERCWRRDIRGRLPGGTAAGSWHEARTDRWLAIVALQRIVSTELQWGESVQSSDRVHSGSTPGSGLVRDARLGSRRRFMIRRKPRWLSPAIHQRTGDAQWLRGDQGIC